MRPMLHIVAASAGFLLCTTAAMAAGISVAPADAGPPGVLDIVGAEVEANDEIQSHFKTCPAEAADSARPLWRRWIPHEDFDIDACGDDIRACYKACMEDRDAGSCLSLGYTFEAAIPAVPPLWAQMIYAQACAAGSTGGCTNRGAGIRNGQFDGDPLLNGDQDNLEGCFLRTFTLSCSKDEAWGCTMLGQSYQYGEGAPPDALMAKRYYEKSCSIAEDFAACRFARERMKDLE